MLFNKSGFQRSFIGIVLKGLFETNYFVPITTQHDTTKIINSEEIFVFHKGRRSVLNFNLMIPVPASETTTVKIKYVKNEYSKHILNNQYSELIKHQDVIALKALNTYLKVLDNPDSRLAKRSNDFLLLEKKSLEWEESHPSGKNPVRGDKINTQTPTYIEAQKVLGQEKLDQILNR